MSVRSRTRRPDPPCPRGRASGQPVSVLRPASLFGEYITGDALNPLLALVFQRKSVTVAQFQCVSSARGKSANASSFSRFGSVSPSAARLMISSARASLVAFWSRAQPLASKTSHASLKAISSIASVGGSAPITRGPITITCRMNQRGASFGRASPRSARDRQSQTQAT